MRPCYTGSPPTLDIGTCRGGMEKCEAGMWGKCVGEILPKMKDDCKTPEDENCDGEVNDKCEMCEPGMMIPCYTGPRGTEGIGPCHAGTSTCGMTGDWGPCEDQVVPLPEEDCQTPEDDDCNGTAECP